MRQEQSSHCCLIIKRQLKYKRKNSGLSWTLQKQRWNQMRSHHTLHVAASAINAGNVHFRLMNTLWKCRRNNTPGWGQIRTLINPLTGNCATISTRQRVQVWTNNIRIYSWKHQKRFAPLALICLYFKLQIPRKSRKIIWSSPNFQRLLSIPIALVSVNDH